jgi:hypothetical protein
MKRILKLTFVTIVLSALCACEDKVETPRFLEVTPNNISGSWRLESSCGEPLANGCYVYIDFDRKERTFKMYQNTDSFSTRYITGRYFIYTDGEAGAVIRGDYDYGNGAWTHRYIVSDLTSKRMIWRALDDPDYIDIYVRCDIPTEIRAAGIAE